MASQITTEEDDAEAPCVINTEAEKVKIRRIIKRQRSQYLSSSSSSSFSSATVSCSSSSLSSSHRNGNLLQLMKVGSTSLRRLFDMEHTSLATHFNDYSGSPVTKPILLWGSDSDDGAYDPWEFFKQNVKVNNFQNKVPSRLSFSSPYVNVKNTESSKKEAELSFHETKRKSRNRKLARTRSFRRLPKLGIWIWRGFRFRLRLRRLRIMICGRQF
ncbi:hypothetical protein QQ045_028383 [Rhodiola kirilowii]